MKRTTLAEGIYRDAHGIDIIASMGTWPNKRTEKLRKDLTDADGVPYSRLNRNLTELIFLRAELMEKLKADDRATRGAGSLADDVVRYLRGLADGPKKDDFTYLLQRWADSPLGAMSRRTIRRNTINNQLIKWQDEGVAAVTLNHRSRALRALFVALHEGKDDDPLATDKIKHFRPAPAAARGIPLPIIARILSHMPDRGRAEKGKPPPTYSETKIRCRCMAWTGLPHKQLERLERSFFRARAAMLHVPARKKGRGAPAVDIGLIPPAVDAFKDFDAANLWGKSWSRSSMRKSWTAAIKATRAALEADAKDTGDATLLEQFSSFIPADTSSHPYDLRHSYLTDLYQETGDINAVAAHAQQSQLETTQRYTQAGVSVRVAAAVEKMRDRWARMPKPPAVKPARTRPFPALVTRAT